MPETREQMRNSSVLAVCAWCPGSYELVDVLARGGLVKDSSTESSLGRLSERQSQQLAWRSAVWGLHCRARQKIWIEWLQEELAVLGVEEYDPAPIPYCKRSPCYEGPGFEVQLSDIDPDSDAD